MPSILRSLTTLAFLLSLTTAVAAQHVSYTVNIPAPTTRLIDVTMDITDAAAASVDVAMAMWVPGGYGSSWFAKNVQELKAEDDSGKALQTEQVGLSKWRVATADGQVRISYKVYSPLQNGFALLDDSHFRMAGITTLMYVVGEDPYPAPGPLSLKINAPDDWVFATGLDQVSRGQFTAPDYDTLVDAPVEVASALDVMTFKNDGVDYEIAIRNPHNLDRDAFRKGVKDTVAELTSMMGGAPFKRYVFIMTGIDSRGGGLEHLNSTTISFKRYDDVTSPDYHRLQFLVAHEFFHLWNVKRIRPAILGPFDYSKPQPTRNLYVSEGMTDYMAYMGVTRAGVWTHEQLYKELASVIETLQNSPGRHIASVEQASYRVWTRSDNPDATISYYTKGSLIGLLLDLEIRARTDNRRSIVDVFRYLFAENGLPKPGFEETHGFQRAVEKTVADGGGDADFSTFFSDYVSGVDELDYNRYLKHAGLQLTVASQQDQAKPSLDLDYAMTGGQMIVTGVKFDGAAYRGGIMTGDELVLLDGERVVESTLEPRLRSIGAGNAANLQVIRGDRFIPVTVKLAEHVPVTYRITEIKNVTAAQRKIRDGWLKPYHD